MVIFFLSVYTDFTPQEIKQELKNIYGIGHTTPSKTVRSKRIEEEGWIPVSDVEEALEMYKQSLIDDVVIYLNSIITNLTPAQIAAELVTLHGIELKPKKISSDDINEGLEFYGYAYGQSLREKMVNYIQKKYEHLNPDEIRRQLKPFDFDQSVTTKPDISSESYGDDSWLDLSLSPRKITDTPSPRGATRHPSDFTPSRYGAGGFRIS